MSDVGRAVAQPSARLILPAVAVACLLTGPGERPVCVLETQGLDIDRHPAWLLAQLQLAMAKVEG
jgi:hypothetical protein